MPILFQILFTDQLLKSSRPIFLEEVELETHLILLPDPRRHEIPGQH